MKKNYLITIIAIVSLLFIIIIGSIYTRKQHEQQLSLLHEYIQFEKNRANELEEQIEKERNSRATADAKHKTAFKKENKQSFLSAQIKIKSNTRDNGITLDKNHPIYIARNTILSDETSFLCKHNDKEYVIKKFFISDKDGNHIGSSFNNKFSQEQFDFLKTLKRGEKFSIYFAVNDQSTTKEKGPFTLIVD